MIDLGLTDDERRTLRDAVARLDALVGVIDRRSHDALLKHPPGRNGGPPVPYGNSAADVISDALAGLRETADHAPRAPGGER